MSAGPARPALFGGPPVGTLSALGGRPALLGLHGFGATPQEVAMVVEIARERGASALCPLLPGHGSSVYDLGRTRYADWRGAAEQALFELALRHGRVIIVGSSMGSLLALDLAADHPEIVAGVGVLGCPIRLPWPFPSLALALVTRLGIPDFTLHKAAPDIRDAEARRTQVTYSEQPAYAGNEVRLAGRRVERRLGQVRCPAFVAHGRHDHVAPARNAQRVYAKLGTPPWQKELLILEHSYHIITRDLERGVLRTRLTRFVGRVADALPADDGRSDPRRAVAAGGALRL